MLSTHDYLSLVSNRSQRNLPLNRVYRNIRNETLFLIAYGNLYANKGALTKGSDPRDTIQGMSKRRITQIVTELAEGRYKWTPARTAYIPKTNGKRRRLSVPGWRDKLLQEVIRMVLEAYYEPRFRDCSHGFRPNRGCHTALQHIQKSWTGTKWFIEGDIKGCFDTIDHTLLLDTIREDIHDDRFLKLLRAMLEAGYMEKWQYHRTHSGTPQGGVVSPLLANIMLHKLDVFVEDVLIPKHTRGKLRKGNPEYHHLQYLKGLAKARGDKAAFRQIELRQRQLPSKRTHDEKYARLRYVRYADDFILGFAGSKAEAETIKAEIEAFLQSIKLTLSSEKTLITHAKTERARFLGYELATRWDDSKLIRRNNDPKQKVRQINGNIGLYVPKSVRQEWVSQYTKRGKPHRVGRLHRSTDFEIVRDFGVKFRGLANYYCMAGNINYELSLVRWVMMQSLVKTLKRNSKTSLQSVYQRYYKRSAKTGRKHFRVEIARDGKPPLVATFGEEKLAIEPTALIHDSRATEYQVRPNKQLVSRLLANKCELCGAVGATEGHHVHKLSEIRKRYRNRQSAPTWAVWMMQKHRKVIFVCRSCHNDITHGRYDGAKLI